jgi:hypothetical protein
MKALTVTVEIVTVIGKGRQNVSVGKMKALTDDGDCDSDW